ncbi:unnamed protein product [Acanthoscelides obtectus]|uniref:Uncharacterized protein n=1 Tax=Acanthoscelides obtectus TaxID=200917 RepID=A0A9P0KV33_ACAOB|nr:unnamed protein product [Acanthoscelides obtectus]CAK1676106.1 hypothetical protein AOBTE_LOCUS30589 [Acanthoscelides obtectus]
MDTSFSYNYPLKPAANLMNKQKEAAEEENREYMRRFQHYNYYYRKAYKNTGVQGNLEDDQNQAKKGSEGLKDNEAEVELWTTNFEDDLYSKDQLPGQYSCSLFNHQLVREELFQQNLLAKQMLYRYFYDGQRKIQDDNKQKGKEEAKEEENRQKIQEMCDNIVRDTVSKISNEAKACIRTMSSILNMYMKKDKSGQICIKPSDMYVPLANSTEIVKSMTSVKFIRPYKYHKAYLESLADVDRLIKQTSHPKNMKICLKDEALQVGLSKEFISARSPEDSQHRILFRNNSVNNDSSCSLANGDMNGPKKSDEYLNLYGVEYFKNRARKGPGSNCSFDKRFKFLESLTNLSVSETEYKKWLRRNNFTKYVTCSVRASTGSSSEKLTLIPETVKSVKKLTRRSKVRRKRSDVLDHACRTIIYEHTVVLNFIDLINYIRLRRRKGLTPSDRVLQVIFFLLCYFALTVVNSCSVMTGLDRWSK